MSPRLRLPRVLAAVANTGLVHEASGSDVSTLLDDLFDSLPGLRNHVLDESGSIRPHVSIFVDGQKASLTTPVGIDSEVFLLQAVSGG